MINDFLVRYETDLIERTTKEVTERITEQVTRAIAKNLKGVLPVELIAEHTGLSLKEVQNL